MPSCCCALTSASDPTSSARCCEATQLRLHQLEASRAKEMHAHGELVGRLERDVESRRAHHQDMQSTLAKLSSDHTRLDAEHQTLRSKLALEREQHESVKLVLARLREELSARRKQTDGELQQLRDALEQMQRTDSEQRVHQAVLQTQLDALRSELALVIATRETALQTLSTTSLECARLADALTAKQHDADKLALRIQLLSDDLAQSRATSAAVQQRADALEKSRDAALRTRNRTLAWRKQRVDVAAARAFRQTLLLAWRAFALHRRGCKARDVDARLSTQTAALRAHETQLRTKLVDAQTFLRALRRDVHAFPTQLTRFRDDVCCRELPQLVMQLAMAREHCAMAIADSDAQHRVALECAAQTLATRRKTFKNRQHALLALLFNAKRRDAHRLAFHGWKDVYLRNVVAQTTHAAMLAQQQVASLVAAAAVADSEATAAAQAESSATSTTASQRRGSRVQASQLVPQREPPPRLYFSSLALEQHRALVKKTQVALPSTLLSVDGISEQLRPPPAESMQPTRRRASIAVAAATAERDWERWRRVQPSAIHERKASWVAAATLPVSPTATLASRRSYRERKS